MAEINLTESYKYLINIKYNFSFRIQDPTLRDS